MAPALSPAALAAAEAAEAQISADVSEDNVGSISLGIVAPGGQLIRHRAFGWARKGFGGAEWLPNRGPGFIYRIGSISKSVTVVGLMSLVEEGILSLTDLASAPRTSPSPPPIPHNLSPRESAESSEPQAACQPPPTHPTPPLTEPPGCAQGGARA